MIRLKNWRSGHWILAGTIAIILFCLGAIVDRNAFFACWLTAWWTSAGAVLGSQANLWLHNLTGGAWGVPLRPTWQRAAAATPMLLSLMLPMVAAVWLFYPWSQPHWMPQSDRPAFQAYWLSPFFVTIRMIIYALLWQALALMTAHHTADAKARKGASGVALFIYGITMSLASVDLLASLIPQWHSSGFGLIIIAMQMKLGFALAVVGAESGPDSSHTIPAALRGDWGNMLLMYVMMWAYVAFVQFLIIWAENLPNEIVWYVPRMQTGWLWLGVLLVVAGLFVPLFLLLFRAIKQDRLRLRKLAAVLCLLGWFESVWVTLPSIRGLTWHAVWMAPLALIGAAALLIAFALPRKDGQLLRERLMQRKLRETRS